MARSETASRGLVIYVTSNLFTTPSTPGTARTATSISRRRSALRASPCSVTTKEQELTLIRGPPRKRGSRPSAPRTSWTSSASFAGFPSGDSPQATLLFRTEPGQEGEAAVAHPALVEWLLELGLTGEFNFAS